MKEGNIKKANILKSGTSPGEILSGENIRRAMVGQISITKRKIFHIRPTKNFAQWK